MLSRSMLALLLICSMASISGVLLLTYSRRQHPMPYWARLENHRFLFIVGSHHSGTSLVREILKSNTRVSVHTNTDRPEDEGQFLQHLYPIGADLGGTAAYALNPASYMNETHALVTDSNRETLYRAWAAYWDLTREVLVEKSPRHSVMTRFLQEMFGRERSSFIVVLRHPWGTGRFLWETKNIEAFRDCGESFLRNWLKIYQTLARDVRHLRNAVVVQYEHIMEGDAQGIIDALQVAVGLEPEVQVKFENRTATKAKSLVHVVSRQQHNRPGWQGRVLQEYHGSRTNVRADADDEFSWVYAFRKFASTVEPGVCRSVIERYEDSVAAFGYSLRSVLSVTRPAVFREWYVWSP